MDTAPLEEAKRLIGKYLDNAPVTGRQCPECGRYSSEAMEAHKEREMLQAAITRLTRVVDFRKAGIPL